MATKIHTHTGADITGPFIPTGDFWVCVNSGRCILLYRLPGMAADQRYYCSEVQGIYNGPVQHLPRGGARMALDIAGTEYFIQPVEGPATVEVWVA